MSEDAPKPKQDRRPSVPDPATVEAAMVAQLAREVVEVIGADAVLIVWTKQRRRKTSISMTSLGNALTVKGLMAWIAEKVEEEADEEDDDEDDDE